MKASSDTRRYSLETAPSRPVDEEFWRTARVVMPPPGKTSVHLRLDADVLAWFCEQGPGPI